MLPRPVGGLNSEREEFGGLGRNYLLWKSGRAIAHQANPAPLCPQELNSILLHKCIKNIAWFRTWVGF